MKIDIIKDKKVVQSETRKMLFSREYAEKNLHYNTNFDKIAIHYIGDDWNNSKFCSALYNLLAKNYKVNLYENKNIAEMTFDEDIYVIITQQKNINVQNDFVSEDEWENIYLYDVFDVSNTIVSNAVKQLNGVLIINIINKAAVEPSLSPQLVSEYCIYGMNKAIAKDFSSKGIVANTIGIDCNTDVNDIVNVIELYGVNRHINGEYIEV